MLPGEMKELMNSVTDAKKAAEAALITRREETAAMRSQANTARLLEQNPTLMRLREIEALEKVAEKGRLSVVVGEGGLAGRVVKLVSPYPGGAWAPPGLSRPAPGGPGYPRACSARSSQPSIIPRPPIGVTAPSQRGAPSAMAYRVPLKTALPTRNDQPAASPPGRWCCRRPSRTRASAWKSW